MTHSPEAQASFTWSEHQNQIFNELTANPSTSYIVDACAGSSKTTTLVESVNRLVHQGIAKPGSILCLAFNKKIATTLQERMPPGTTSSTLNAFGHRALGRFIPVNRLQVSQWKEANLWQNIPAYEALEKPERKAIQTAYMQFKISGTVPAQLSWELAQARPNFLADYLTGKKLVPLSEHSAEAVFSQRLHQESTELDPRDWHQAFREVATLDLYLSLAEGQISFQDQLYLPALCSNVTLPTYLHVFVDEAQDLGTLEHALVQKIVSRFPRGRLIAVGDRAQAIYAFRGAHYDSMDRLAHKFGANWLSLPVSFRCPTEVVREAQRFDSRIQPWDSAPTGSVSRLDSWSPATLPRPSTVLCRVNSPLVKLGLELIQAGIGAHFLARDFESQLHDFHSTWRKKSKILVGMFLAIEQEADSLEASDSYKADRLRDSKACLEAITEQYNCQSFEELEAGIERLFNSPGPITLATIHKSKGLEWPHVLLLRPDLCPHPKAHTEEDLRQEYNMLYVAITRAQDSFQYLEPLTEKETH
ncbi:UvrD-helicase domain-containing protein [Idiomarina abyssalis]|uniref:UvrD-helicase domain-containing protein n=1 Tax=Idiomarina abyssalis TaxID=86102 RepID=UPI003A93B5EA